MNKLNKTQQALKLVATLCIDKCSQLLSKIIRSGARIKFENVYYGDVTDITRRIMNNNQKEIVAAFIDLMGDAPFKFLFFTGAESSYKLTDLMLQRPVGTTKEYDDYTASAVKETGNILASACTNVFSRDFHIAMYPTPPIIVKDYMCTVFQEYIMSVGSDRNELLIVESTFFSEKEDFECQMFILPKTESEDILKVMMETNVS